MTESLKDKWLRSGVEPGDTLLVHSNIKRMLIESRRAGLGIGPIEILTSFLDAIGDKGTLLLPLFNFDFANGADFDIRSSPSQMGALTEMGRLHKDMVRTGHPIYSFAVIGYKSKEFEGVNNESGYAEDSPFGILKRLGGKIASLDLEDQNSMTYYHHVEEVKGVDYRYFKTFTGKYTDFNGDMQDRSYKLFVRDIEHGVETNVNPAGELMWQAGLYKGYRPKIDTGLRVIKAKDMFSFVEKIIDDGNAFGNLYSVEN
jgi:aminoglycoside 3-N-acetyltransferase